MGSYPAKSALTWCLDRNVCWQYANNYKNPPTPHFLSPLIQINLTKPAVWTLTAVWRHISEGGATGFDWQPCVAIVSTLSGYTVLHFLRARAAVTSTMSR